jgi:hypothetical protein
MVGLTIQCRLGNQLFQYAFIKALSESLSTSYFLNEGIEKFTAAQYFTFKGYNPTINIFNKFFFKIRKKALFKPLQNLTISNFDNPNKIIHFLSNNNSYSGYVQSADYFINISANINEYIKVKTQYIKEFNNKFGNYFNDNKKVIAVHLRRGDYLNLGNWWKDNLGGNDLTLPLSYYKNCICDFEDQSLYNIIFISDDIAYAKTVFSHLKNATFSDNNIIIDFQILMHADVCVISNSSFAWWAAYLNKKATKRVLCPKYWLGHKIQKEYPSNIIPNNWEQVDVSL